MNSNRKNAFIQIGWKVDMFEGADYIQDRDFQRLACQIEKILTFCLDGKWHTVKEISLAVGCPENSAQAQLRNLRKPKHGGWIVERRYVSNGLYQYRVRAATIHEVL